MSAAGRAPCGLPRIGLGTAVQGPRPDPVRAAVLRAIQLGYRHFDTAAHYATEAPIGEAAAEAVRAGAVASREELFITSKVWCADAHPDRVLPALRRTLRCVRWFLFPYSASAWISLPRLLHLLFTTCSLIRRGWTWVVNAMLGLIQIRDRKWDSVSSLNVDLDNSFIHYYSTSYATFLSLS
jgi:hypothetical protein